MYLLFGSADSLDVDVVFIVPSIPETIVEAHQKCLDFKAELAPLFVPKLVNVNLATIAEGRIISVFKGLPDELNNAILATYHFHQQAFKNPITQVVARSIAAKEARVVQTLLSSITKTKSRALIKSALKSDFETQLTALLSFDLSEINDFEIAEQLEIRKRFAFQLGQLALLKRGIEVFTKSEIAEEFPQLKPYLYRDSKASIDALMEFLRRTLIKP